MAKKRSAPRYTCMVPNCGPINMRAPSIARHIEFAGHYLCSNHWAIAPWSVIYKNQLWDRPDLLEQLALGNTEVEFSLMVEATKVAPTRIDSPAPESAQLHLKLEGTPPKTGRKNGRPSALPSRRDKQRSAVQDRVDEERRDLSDAELKLALIRLADVSVGNRSDGVGFSSVDMEFGISLAEWCLSGRLLTRRQADAAQRMLRKYRKQLVELENAS